MKANGKYTALEILQEAGIENPQDKIGKVRVRIGGISGIVNPDDLITIQPNADKIDIIVGNETKELNFESSADEREVSEKAKLALEAKAEKIKVQNKLLRAKKEKASKQE